MIRWLADENFKNTILRGLLRRPSLDIVRAQGALPTGLSDPAVLEFAADANRLLLTLDVNTMTRWAYERIHADLPMSGVFALREQASLRRVLDDLCLVTELSAADEWAWQVIHIPF